MVEINYTVRDENGNVLDSSRDKVVEYLHGSHIIVPGLENALEGKTAGTAFSITLSPAEAYGSIKQELLQQLPRSQFSGIKSLQPGMQLQAQNPDGRIQLFTVQEISEDTVTVDCNHPLAGLNLIFEVKVISVRKASDQELNHYRGH